MLPTLTITTHAPGETQALAARLARRLEAGDVIWMSGDLGAGKTTFTQGLGRALNIAVPINSPTFVLIREYAGRLPLYHIDLYRLNDAREIATLGLADYLTGSGVCVLEWAERLDPRAELPGLHIRIEPQTTSVPPPAAGPPPGEPRAPSLSHPIADIPHIDPQAIILPPPAADPSGIDQGITRLPLPAAALPNIEPQAPGHPHFGADLAHTAGEREHAGARAGDAQRTNRSDEQPPHILGAAANGEMLDAASLQSDPARVLTLSAVGVRAEQLLESLREGQPGDAARN